MDLKPWSHEPEKYHLLTIFTGERKRFEQFIQTWLEKLGNLDIFAVPLDPATLPWSKSKTSCAYAFALARVPTYNLIGWWLQQQPEWRLFYLSLNEKDNDEFRDENDFLFPLPDVYLPWGLEVDEKTTSNGKTVLLLEDGRRAELPPRATFENLFQLFDEPRPTISGPNGTLFFKKAKIKPSLKSEPYPLPLKLIEELEHQRPDNLENEIERLQNKINSLQEELDFLYHWREEPELPYYLYIFPETEQRVEGSAWYLREWFTRAPDEAIRLFLHTRVVVEGIEWPLHLVKLDETKGESKYNLPPPMYRLVKDWRWHQNRHELFVPEKWHLWPPPPNYNTHVVDLMAKCLWENANLNDSLVFLMINDQVCRFSVDTFQPLLNQVNALNIQMATKFSEQFPHLNNMTEQLETIRQQVMSQLTTHAEAMHLELDKLWESYLANLNQYRKETKEALDKIQEIHAWLERLNQFKQKNIEIWATFREEVLNLDLELNPEKDRIGEYLNAFYSIRGKLAELSLNDKPGKRKEIANLIHDLTNRIHDGRLNHL